MRFFLFILILLLPFASLGGAESGPAEMGSLSAKADEVLKLQEKILTSLKEIRSELYIVKIRATRHNRVGHV